MPDANQEITVVTTPTTVVTEVQTPATSVVPQGDPNSGEDQGGEGGEGGENETGQIENEGQPGKKPIQPRINELVRKRHEAEREAAYWKGVAQASTSKPVVESPAPAAAPAKPTTDQFNTYDEYVEALTDWKSDRAVEKALATVNAKIEEKSTQQTAAQQEADRTKNWHARQDATKAVLKDYDEVVGSSDVAIAAHVGDLLLDSDHGPALAYKLAQDPELAAKLNGMSEKMAAKEIGKLEAAFDLTATPSATTTPAAPTAKTNVSKAPVPPSPVTQGRATSKDMSAMSMDEYIAARKAQGAGWAKRG